MWAPIIQQVQDERSKQEESRKMQNLIINISII